MMRNRRTLVAFALVVILASLPYVVAQQQNELLIEICEYDGCSYIISTSLMTVSAERHAENVPNFGLFSTDDPEDKYYVWISTIFEANDTNKDGIFIPYEDEIVGGLLPLGYYNYDRTWNHSNMLSWDEQGHYPELYLDYSANVTFSHQDLELITSAVGWSFIPGHTNPMNIGIVMPFHIQWSRPDQFNLGFQISDWEWSYSDSILVFVLSLTNIMYTEGGTDYLHHNLVHEGNRFTFGKVWIEYPQNASTESAPEQIQVNTAELIANIDYLGSEADLITFAFENFGNETLDSDVFIGLNGTTPSATTPSGIDYNQLLVTAGLVTICTIVIIFVREKKNDAR